MLGLEAMSTASTMTGSSPFAGDVPFPLQAMSESLVDDYAAYYKQNKIRYLEGDYPRQGREPAAFAMMCLTDTALVENKIYCSLYS
jgi:hypothetical protein